MPAPGAAHGASSSVVGANSRSVKNSRRSKRWEKWPRIFQNSDAPAKHRDTQPDAVRNGAGNMRAFERKLNARFIVLIGLFFLVVVSGCTPTDPASLIKKFTPPEDEAIATNYIALLRQNKFEQIQNDLDPSLKNALTQDTLAKMAKAIPPQNPISVKVIGAQQVRDPDIYKINLSFEYQFPSKWLLINVATQKKDGVFTIIGFNVYPQSDSLENLNRFTLAGKNFLQYATLAFAILIPLFSLSVLFLCIKTKMQKRKWLWIIFILIGIGKFTINWTTGQWNLALLSFQLLGSSSFAPPYGAWTISISLPLGAILFLLRRKKFFASLESAHSSSL